MVADSTAVEAGASEAVAETTNQKQKTAERQFFVFQEQFTPAGRQATSMHDCGVYLLKIFAKF